MGSGGGTAIESWAGDLVGAQALVDVDEDTWVVLCVELGTEDTLRLGSTATSDLKVDALRVVLRTAGGASRVKGDDLVTSDVVAWCNVAWDGRGPGVVVGNQLVRGPGAWNGGVADKSTLVDLEPLQSGFVGILTFGRALGKVGDDWAVVAVWPDSPLEGDLATSLDWGVGTSGGSVQVADDVRASVVGDETVGQVVRDGPTDDGWGRALVLEGWAVTSVVGAVNDKTLDGTVSGSRGDEGAYEGSSPKERHFWRWLS